MKFGAPVRGIKNELTKRYHELEAQSSTLMELEELTLGSLRKAVYDLSLIHIFTSPNLTP